MTSRKVINSQKPFHDRTYDNNVYFFPSLPENKLTHIHEQKILNDKLQNKLTFLFASAPFRCQYFIAAGYFVSARIHQM